MAGYKISAAAAADMRRIWDYGFEHWGTTKADRYHSALLERFEQIAEQPLLYPLVDHMREGYRRSVCGRDSIYYRIIGEEVEIMAVIGRQNVKNWL